MLVHEAQMMMMEVESHPLPRTTVSDNVNAEPMKCYAFLQLQRNDDMTIPFVMDLYNYNIKDIFLPSCHCPIIQMQFMYYMENQATHYLR